MIELRGTRSRRCTNRLDVGDVVVEHAIGNSESLGDLTEEDRAGTLDKNRQEENGGAVSGRKGRADLSVSERDPLLDLSVGLGLSGEEARVGGEGSDC